MRRRLNVAELIRPRHPVETPVPEGFFCGQGIGVVRDSGGRRDFFLESFKGQRELPRPARERGGKAAKPGLSDEQIPVLIVRDRNGETFDAILDAIDAEHLGAALKPVLGKDTLLCTDGSKAFKARAKDAGIPPPSHEYQGWHQGERTDFPYPKRQCLRQPVEGVDAKIQWSGHPVSG